MVLFHRRFAAPGILAFLIGVQAGPAMAQGHSGHSMNHDMKAEPKKTGSEAASPATRAFRKANDAMHKDMAISYSGDADIDFIKGMIPHHQGAIDMAKIVLQYGKDPETKKLAEEIIAAQEKEIAFMQDWLKKKGR